MECSGWRYILVPLEAWTVLVLQPASTEARDAGRHGAGIRGEAPLQLATQANTFTASEAAR